MRCVEVRIDKPWTALYREGSDGVGGERGTVVETSAGILAIVADGAGGMAGGAAAAERFIFEVQRDLIDAVDPVDPDAIQASIRRADQVVSAAPACGQASALAVVVGPERVVGATVGPCHAWLHDGTRCMVLSDGGRQALVGSGQVLPRPFEGGFEAGRLLLGNDGFFRYAAATVFRPDGILGADKSPPAILAGLTDGIRLRNGRLQADVCLALIARRRAERLPTRGTRPVSLAEAAVLIVDQNAGFARMAIRHSLSAYLATHVTSGGAARAALQQRDFAAVLVDYDLPDGHGDALIRRLRTDGYTGVIIAISARERGNALMRSAGADEICSKMKFQGLASMLAQLLD